MNEDERVEQTLIEAKTTTRIAWLELALLTNSAIEKSPQRRINLTRNRDIAFRHALIEGELREYRPGIAEVPYNGKTFYVTSDKVYTVITSRKVSDASHP